MGRAAPRRRAPPLCAAALWAQRATAACPNLDAVACKRCRDVPGGVFSPMYTDIEPAWNIGNVDLTYYIAYNPGAASSCGTFVHAYAAHLGTTAAAVCAMSAANLGLKDPDDSGTTVHEDRRLGYPGDIEVKDMCGVTCGECDVSDFAWNTFTVGFPAASAPPWWYYNGSRTGAQRWTGFVPDSIISAQQKLRLDPILQKPDLEFHFEELHEEEPSSALYQPWWQIMTGKIDLVPQHVDLQLLTSVHTRGSQIYSTPVYSGRFQALVRKSVAHGGDSGALSWNLFKPFEPKLWTVSIITVLVLGLLLFLVEGVPPMIAQYLSFSSLLGGEDGWPDGSVVTWSGRIVRVALLFLVFILQNSYTANLASLFISDARVTLYGPASNSELKDPIKAWQVCTTQSDGVVANWLPENSDFVRDYMEANIIFPSGRISYSVWNVTQRDSMAECVELLLKDRKDGGVAAVVDTDIVLQHFLLGDTGNCDKFAIQPQISFGSSAAAMSGRNYDMSTFLMGTGHMMARAEGIIDELLTRHFHIGRVCQASRPPSLSMKLEDLSGLFVIVAVVIGATLFLWSGRLIVQKIGSGKYKNRVAAARWRDLWHRDVWCTSKLTGPCCRNIFNIPHPQADDEEAEEDHQKTDSQMLREILNELRHVDRELRTQTSAVLPAVDEVGAGRNYTGAIAPVATPEASAGRNYTATVMQKALNSGTGDSGASGPPYAAEAMVQES